METRLKAAIVLVILTSGASSEGIVKRNCNHESCNPAYEPFANLHASMVGYDVLKGNPFDIAKLYDPGYRNFIFLPMIKNEQHRYYLHPGVTAKKTLACQLGIRTDEITTVKAYQEKIEHQSSSGMTFTSNLEVDLEIQKGPVKAGTKVPPIVDAAFSSSRAFKENKEFFTSDKGTIIMSDATCPSYTLEIQSFNPPPFSDGFMNALKVLDRALAGSDSVKDQAAAAFFHSFGTHFIKSSVMGARIAITSRYTESEISKLNKNDVTKCNENKVKASVGASVGVSSSGCNGLGVGTSDYVKPNMVRTYVSSYGSKPKSDIIEWANQIFDEPVPIRMELSPILNLFQDSFMNSNNLGFDVDYKAILKYLGSRYWNYCEASKVLLGIESCAVEEQKGCGWNDNCVRGIQSCINRLDAFGKTFAYCCNSPCKNAPCQNGGTCTDQMNTCTYTCACRTSYMGATCNQRYVDGETIKNEILSSMSRNIGQSNDDFRYTLQTELSRAYPGYSFTIDAYNEVSGGESHWVIYTAGVHMWRTHRRNLAVFWARDNSNSGNLGNVRDEVLRRIKDKGDNECKAEWAANEAFNYARNFGATAVHVVRHGNGLRTALGRHATFDNYRCNRKCDILGKCHDQMSSLVIVFG